MSEALTEQEQIESIKNWWRENGTQILVVGCLLAVSYFGYQWWQNSQETKLNEVSTAYEQYMEAMVEASSSLSASETQIKTLDYLTDQLIEQHGGSHYALLASLNTAAFDVRRGEIDAAADRLQWAQDYAGAEADVMLVNYRYALVKAQQGHTDEALAMLNDSNDEFASIYAEARGDIQLSLGMAEAALADYEAALDLVSEDEPNRASSLQVKIDNLLNGPQAITAAP